MILFLLIYTHTHINWQICGYNTFWLLAQSIVHTCVLHLWPAVARMFCAAKIIMDIFSSEDMNNGQWVESDVMFLIAGFKSRARPNGPIKIMYSKWQQPYSH